MKEIKDTIPNQDIQKVASEHGTEFIFYENSSQVSGKFIIF